MNNLRWIVVFGVIEFGIPWYCMSTAERHITSSLTSLFICCVPLFAVVAQRLRRTEERISRVATSDSASAPSASPSSSGSTYEAVRSRGSGS